MYKYADGILVGAFEQICWRCDNAYAHKCKWIRTGSPQEGCEVRTHVRKDGSIGEAVIRCEHYIPEPRSDRRHTCAKCGKRFYGGANQKYCSLACRRAGRLEKLRKTIAERRKKYGA